MRRRWFGAVIALAVFAAPPANAQSNVTQLGAKPTADELIRALAVTPGLTSRGIIVHGANPAVPAEAPAPAAAVDIRFALNSAALTDEAKWLINQIATAMKSDQLGHSPFVLEGHTDTTGRPDYNLALSTLRANAVRDELIKTYGIAPARLRALGRGQEQLLDPQNPQSAVNRRVVIVNLGG